MDKRFWCYLLALLCICLVFSACSNGATDNVPSDISSPLPQEAPSTKKSSTEYDKLLNNIINAYPWDDDVINIVPENPELSFLYYKANLSDIGFALKDLDNNGQEELIISDTTKNLICDVYTIINGKAEHLFAGHERNSYWLHENGFIENQWLGSAATSGHDFYKLENGALCFIERITLDADHAMNVGIIKDLTEATDNNCFFRSKTTEFADYEFIPADKATNLIKTCQNANTPLEIEYTPLSEYKSNE